MQPGAHTACHVEACRRSKGQHLTGTLLSDTNLQQLLIELAALIKQQLGLELTVNNKFIIEIIDAVLTVLKVLTAKSRGISKGHQAYLGIPLGELLKGEAPMAEDLSSDRAGGVDLQD